MKSSSLSSKLNLMRAAGAALALALLASCGGGDQVEPFSPNRLVVFGDEQSLIDDSGSPGQGRKYTVNGVGRNPDGSLNGIPDCTRNPIWVQVVANDYGFQFAECLSAGVTPRAFMQAQPSSTVAMVQAQVSAYMASPGFTDADLVTLMVGTHDVLAAAGAATPAAAIAAADAAGRAVGDEVVRITDRGAKVLVSTIPNVGTAPQERGDPARVELLTTLTESFNAALRRRLQDVRGGGTAVGLVRGEELVLMIQRAPSAYGISNIEQAACTGSLLSCTEQTGLVPEATTPSPRSSEWLWAGPLQLGSNVQARLGAAAVYRARNNPF